MSIPIILRPKFWSSGILDSENKSKMPDWPTESSTADNSSGNNGTDSSEKKTVKDFNAYNPPDFKNDRELEEFIEKVYPGETPTHPNNPYNLKNFNKLTNPNNPDSPKKLITLVLLLDFKHVSYCF